MARHTIIIDNPRKLVILYNLVLDREADGCYYGNQKHYYKHIAELKQVLEDAMDACYNPPKSKDSGVPFEN